MPKPPAPPPSRAAASTTSTGAAASRPLTPREREPWSLGGVDAERDDYGYRVEVTVLRRDGRGRVVGAVDAVWYFNFDGAVESLRMERPSGVELDASFLRRFAWVRWRTIAEAALDELRQPGDRSLDAYFSGEAAAKVTAARRRQLKRMATRRKPGRQEVPDDHYLAVAERYRELRLSGSPRPTADIADEWHVNRATAAGWVHKARLRDYLPPARIGRPN